jgi:hypothetical protein
VDARSPHDPDEPVLVDVVLLQIGARGPVLVIVVLREERANGSRLPIGLYTKIFRRRPSAAAARRWAWAGAAARAPSSPPPMSS